MQMRAKGSQISIDLSRTTALLLCKLPAMGTSQAVSMMADSTDQTGYRLHTHKIRRFRYEDTNVAKHIYHRKTK